MSHAAFFAMGTEWWITADRADLLPRAEATVRELEARLSRFQPGSAVRRLRERGSVDDPILASVVRAALQLGLATGGAFDITLGRELEALGYDRTFSALSASTSPAPTRGAPTAVRVDGDRVEVDGPGWLDVGGVAKGWAVDHVHDLLREQGAAWALVDGGGDLRGSGRRWPVGVGDDHAVHLDGDAIATSSAAGRRWAGPDGARRHHILDPATALPSDAPIVAAAVRAATATTADALATALVAAPRRALPCLAAIGARAMLQDTDGAWWLAGPPLEDP